MRLPHVTGRRGDMWEIMDLEDMRTREESSLATYLPVVITSNDLGTLIKEVHAVTGIAPARSFTNFISRPQSNHLLNHDSPAFCTFGAPGLRALGWVLFAWKLVLSSPSASCFALLHSAMNAIPRTATC